MKPRGSLTSGGVLACFLFVTGILPSFALARQDSAGLVGARSLALSPDGQQLAFVYRGDIWVGDAKGGRANPITTNVEMEDTPLWSPDGKSIVFTTNRNGNSDIYIVPSSGGQSRRLTWSSAGESATGWSADGKRVVYRAWYDKKEPGLYTLDVQTLAINEILIDFAGLGGASFSPDGSLLVHNRFGFGWVRPRYSGSGAAQLIVTDATGKNRRVVRNNGFQHHWPAFTPDNRSLLAVTVSELTPSSRKLGEAPTKFTDNANRTPNVYQIGLDGRGRRLTDFVGGSGPRFLTVASRTGLMAFERDGTIYTMTPGGKPQAVRFNAFLDDKNVIEERLILTSGAEAMTVDPKAENIVFQIRRELWQVPVKKGRGPNADDATQLTAYAGLDEEPLYTPDGKSVFFVSDRDGANSLYRLDLETKKATLVVKTVHDVSDLRLTPDRLSITYWVSGPETAFFRLPIAGGEPVKVIQTSRTDAYAFSPDMKYLAYGKELLNSGFNPWENRNNIVVRELATGKEANVTRLSAYHDNIAWSPDGKYLYFRSDRQGGSQLFAIPAQAEEARGFELELKYTKPTAPVVVDFALEDAHQRIRLLYGGNVSGNLVPDPETGNIYFTNNGEIWRVSYSGEEARPIVGGGGIGAFTPTLDGNQFSFIRGGILNLVNIRQPNFPVASVGFRADWTRDVLAERMAAFDQFWRIYNLTFYDSNFHGRDWAAIRDRYRPLIESVGHRNEMATVLNMMVGELESSHSEVGAAGGNPRSQSTAHLGFAFDYSHQGPGIKIAEVPRRSPGSFAKTRLTAGEFVLAVNGQDVKPDQNLFRLLNDQAGREVTLLVNSTPSKIGARTVKYRALDFGAWDNLNYRNTVDARRQLVEQKSGGRIGYLHIAGMGGGNLRDFNLEAWEVIQGKSAAIIDVRENGGGNIADTLLDILERNPQMRYVPRDRQETFGPGTSWGKPTVVMHAESSLSNAEMFPAAMKARGLATLVGMPTPGYVIYTYGGQLVDGTNIRQPSTGVFRLDGTPTENMGQQPDIRVDWAYEDWLAGRDPQLERAVDELLKRLR